MGQKLSKSQKMKKKYNLNLYIKVNDSKNKSIQILVPGPTNLIIHQNASPYL